MILALLLALSLHQSGWNWMRVSCGKEPQSSGSLCFFSASALRKVFFFVGIIWLLVRTHIFPKFGQEILNSWLLMSLSIQALFGYCTAHGGVPCQYIVLLSDALKSYSPVSPPRSPPDFSTAQEANEVADGQWEEVSAQSCKLHGTSGIGSLVQFIHLGVPHTSQWSFWVSA